MTGPIYAVCFREMAKAAGVVSALEDAGAAIGRGAKSGLHGAIFAAKHPLHAAANVAEHAGQGIQGLAKDTAHATAHVFNPAAWGEGAREFKAEHGSSAFGKATGVLSAGATGADAVHTLGTKTDERTGRHIGADERVGRTLAHVGSDLTAYHTMKGKNLLRTGVAVLGAREIGDRAAGAAGRLADRRRAPQREG